MFFGGRGSKEQKNKLYFVGFRSELVHLPYRILNVQIYLYFILPVVGIWGTQYGNIDIPVHKRKVVHVIGVIVETTQYPICQYGVSLPQKMCQR